MRHFGWMLLIAMMGCSDDQDRFETVAKLRAIGVTANPAVFAPSTTDAPQTVQLTFVAMIPAGEQISIEEYRDEGGFGASISELTIDEDSATYEDYGPVQLFTVNASFVAPAEAVMDQAGVDVLRLRYGIELSSGSEGEKIVGDVLMLRPDSEELSWQAPDVNIVSPEADASLASGEISLQAEATDHNDERIKYGWFVTSGKVENRRSVRTTWDESDSGAQVVVFTARGVSSRAFSYAIRNVDVN